MYIIYNKLAKTFVATSAGHPVEFESYDKALWHVAYMVDDNFKLDSSMFDVVTK